MTSRAVLIATATLALQPQAWAEANTQQALTLHAPAQMDLSQAATQAYGKPAAAIILAAFNQLEQGAVLSQGQAIRIPVSDKIQVRKVSAVSALARRHLKGRNRASILAAVNNLGPHESVKALTVLTIPSLIWHVVQKGENMKGLSRRYYQNSDGRWLLRKANGGRTSNRLEEGELIAVPIFAPWSDREAVEARLGTAGWSEGGDGGTDDASRTDGAALLDDGGAQPPAAETSEGSALEAEARQFAALDAPIIRHGVDLYRRGDYLAGVAYFRRTLLEPTLDSELRVAAYVWLGACYVAVDETERAEEAMRAALRTDPRLTLNPAYTSPKILKVLERVRERMRSSSKRLP